MAVKTVMCVLLFLISPHFLILCKLLGVGKDSRCAETYSSNHQRYTADLCGSFLTIGNRGKVGQFDHKAESASRFE